MNFKEITSLIKTKLDVHTFEVLLTSSKTVIVKVLGMIAGLIGSIFLGRVLGADGLGVINIINKLGFTLLTFTLFGFRPVIIKYVSIAKSKQLFDDILGTVKSALIFNGLLSICLAAIGVLLLPQIIKIFSDNQELYYPLLIGFFMLIPQTYSRVYASALNGYGKIWQSNLIEQSFSSILVLIGLCIFWITGVSFTPIGVLLLYAISRVVLLFVIKIIWDHSIKVKKKKVEINLRPMLKMGIHMLLVTGTIQIASNMDSLMLGSLSSLYEVGLYSVATKLALLTSFFLVVSNAAIAPKIAALYNKANTDELDRKSVV